MGVVSFLLAAFGCGLLGFRAALVGHCVVHVASGPVINEALFLDLRFCCTVFRMPCKLFPSVVSPPGGACSVVMGNVTLRQGYSRRCIINSHVPGLDGQHPTPMAMEGLMLNPFSPRCGPQNVVEVELPRGTSTL